MSRSGLIFEASFDSFLLDLGYNLLSRREYATYVPLTFTNNQHIPDRVLEYKGRLSIVSFKYQQVKGTAEQKIPFEVIKLAHCLKHSTAIDFAFLVLGGNGWTNSLFEFYTQGRLADYIEIPTNLLILPKEDWRIYMQTKQPLIISDSTDKVDQG